jgi:hypothetical protein
VTQTVQIGIDPQGNPIMGPAPQSDVALFGPRAPEREALETGFNQAREGILSRTPMRGGQLNQTLANLEVDRARSLGQMEAGATQQALGFATGAPFTAPGAAIAGLGSAAGQFGNIAQREQAQQSSKDQSIGQTAAAIAKAVAMG